MSNLMSKIWDDLPFILPMLLIPVMIAFFVLTFESQEDKAIKACTAMVQADSGNPVAKAEQLSFCIDKTLKAFKENKKGKL